MKPTSFAALAVVTALAVALAIVSYASNNRWSQAKVSGSALFPGLAADAGKIARIELRQGEKTLALARDKDSWSLADRSGYPAKGEAVRALVLKLAQAELIEPKTRSKERYGLLELEEPGGKDAKSRSVRLLDEKGGLLGEAVVGKKRMDALGASKSGTYVRKPGDAQTWLSNADLDIPVSVRDWVQPSILDLGAPKIADVSIEIPGEEPLKITRQDGKHTLVGIPDGKKLKDGTHVDAIVRAAGALDFEDVRKLEGTPAGEVSVVKLQADGGLALTLRLRKEGEDYWLSLDASGEGDGKATAEDITRRTQGWEFKMPASRAQAILKRRADLFEAS